jgi:quercetin dioxygenase-like cupin family protein
MRFQWGHYPEIYSDLPYSILFMEIKPCGSRPSTKGPSEYFTGTVRIDPLNEPPEPARVSMALVTFEPGARTAWHTHPYGQTLIVTAGAGWVQKEGEAKRNIFQGDIVYFHPNEKHWHGATQTTAMSHIAVQEKLEGSPVTWLEQVAEEIYLR